jgi:predicted DsbA family dithiol-disulfide isomerase
MAHPVGRSGLLLLFLAAAACGPAGAPDTTALKAKLQADEQISLARFTPEETDTLARILQRTATPCDGVRTIADELLDPQSTCARARGAARFAARRLVDGYGPDDIETQILRRYRETEPVEINTEGAASLGPADAPATVIVFSDFECPVCARAAEVLRRIHERSPDGVRIVFKHFPLERHPMAMSAARASIAAGLQDKFWEFHDIVFANQEDIGPGLYMRAATELGLDVDRFEAERISEASAVQVQADREEGLRLGVEATPAIFVNGRRFQDSVEYLEEWIEEE